MTTRILFDVDGVFNAFGRTVPRTLESTGWNSWETVEVVGYPITFAPELIDRVNALAERDDVEVLWLTTWCDLAPQSLAPALAINGVDWPVLGHRSDPEMISFGWWKLARAREAFDETTDKVIWIDDDHGWYAGNVDAWINSRRNRTGAEVHKIAPNPNFGITREMMEYIESLV